MFAAIGRGFRRVFDVSGRDSLHQFWPYAFLILGLAFAAGAAIWLPAFSGSLARMQAYAQAHPDEAQVMTGPGSYSISIKGDHPELFPDLGPTMLHLGGVMALAALMLASAVARRLHDTGRRGAWGLLPIPFAAFSFAATPRILGHMGQGDPAFGLFFASFLAGALYVASLTRLLFFLIEPGRAEPNRYCAPPPG